jgi:hypothetical protein
MKNAPKEYDKVLYYLNNIIVGCSDVISDARKYKEIHKDAVTVAKLVKKDCCFLREELEKLWTPAQKNTDTDAK